MNINVKLDRNFTTQFNALSEKFGDEMKKINGFSDNNFNLSGFIDAFIDSENTANATIDANANVQSKDIVNLVDKELKKLGLSLNKEKINLITRKSRQIVTGIVVNEKIQVNIDYRKEIRKEIF